MRVSVLVPVSKILRGPLEEEQQAETSGLYINWEG